MSQDFDILGLIDGAIGQAHSDFIVTMNRCGRLRVAKVGEHLSLLVRDLGSGKSAPVLRFLNGRAHHGDTRGVHGDGGIEEGGVVRPRKMVVRPCRAASVGPGKERGVSEDVEGRPEDMDPFLRCYKKFNYILSRIGYGVVIT